MMEKKNIELKNIVEKQKKFFNTNTTKPVAYRIEMLQKLKKVIEDHEEVILSSLYEDLSKSKAEAYMTEIAMVYGEIHEALKNVKKWSRPQRVKGTLSTFPARNYIYSEPYGVVLIMSPWNYPFNLAIAPLVAAIVSGNCAVIKCSKESSHTSKVIEKIINETFEENYIFCVDANIDYDEVLYQKYDYIFFTGSPRVGKIVMRAASDNLIPVSLELGGKSPCIIDETADIELAAKRIAWGKLLNAGQTCVSIDYVVVHSSIKDVFIKALQEEIGLRYFDAVNNDTYPRIINERHYERLLNLIKTEKNVIGGQKNDKERKIGPTIFPDVDFNHEIMKEEIFGPLLPVIEYDDINEVIHIIKEREKPLACYIFSQEKKNSDYIIHSISYGGGCVNDVILQTANHHMPFGGVGYSGMGAYHGKSGFDILSHKKGVVRNKTIFDLPFRYAPFNEAKFKKIKGMM
ncbi:aldehyde dehydrogenase [Peptoniphilus sp. oral taxon 386]|uniref:aldehyde dehydrogenase n=1 Tax=Peptoniphilus sp. oral taxon 386 TaxID=652713 RepID=UPI0002F7DE68|nr:aldehyde dehydrogenase [Peptoniphilus sp. oral taxon 386]